MNKTNSKNKNLCEYRPWAQIHILGPLSLDSNPSSRLKNLMDIDKWSSLSLSLSVTAMSVTRGLALYLYSWDGSIVTLSPAGAGDIVFSINMQHNAMVISPRLPHCHACM